MPVFYDIRTCDQLAPYHGLAPSPARPTIPTGEFRNVFFLGWGIGYEQEFLTECNYTPTHLQNLVVRANGQDMYKEVNPLDPKCNLGHVVDQYHGGSHTLHLHNAGNDSHWELWATLKAIRQGLGLLHSDSAGMNMREAYFTISWDDPSEVINPRDFAQEVAAARLPYIPVAAAENPAPFQPTTATEAPLRQEPIAVTGDKR